MPGRIRVVVGGQYGSEAKGHVAAQLVKRHQINYAVRVGGPNAGHSVIDEKGQKFALRTLPVAAAINDTTQLVIAAGSEIDVDVLWEEINLLESAGHPVRERLMIDSTATIITQEHKQAEGLLTSRLGSTAKGIGAARAARIMRQAPIAEHIKSLEPMLRDTTEALQQNHAIGAHILIEGTQGYQLGVNHKHYPFSTSGNCRAIDFLAQCGLMPHVPPVVWCVFRTHPIRVAGNSGPLPRECTWEELGERTAGYIKPERTTVTKKIRRVADWSSWDAREAIRGNGGEDFPGLRLALMFVDYLDPEIAGTTDFDVLRSSKAWRVVERFEREIGKHFSCFGTSASTVVWRS